MEKREPREVLDVRANASMTKCKKTYHKLVMELHPDRNPGDDAAAERFKEVQDAWDRLNGKDCAAMMLDGRATANLCDLFVNITGELLQKGGDPCERDLKASMKAKLDEHKRTVDAKLIEIHKQHAKMKRMVGRWGGEEHPLEQVMAAKIAQGDGAIQATEQEQVLVKRCLEMLGGWTFKHDVAAKPKTVQDMLSGWRMIATTT